MTRPTHINRPLAHTFLIMSMIIAGVSFTPASFAQVMTWDFESGDLTGWTNVPYAGGGTGDAFLDGHQPQNYDHVMQGTWSLNTWAQANPNVNGDYYTGIIETDSFVVSATGTISFLMTTSPYGFTGDPDAPNANMTCVNLEREVAPGDWEMVETAFNGQNWNYVPKVWDTTPYLGDIVRIRVYDTSTASWGHTSVDNIIAVGLERPGIRFSDLSVSSVTLTSALAHASLAMSGGATGLDAAVFWATSDLGHVTTGWLGTNHLGFVSTGLVDNVAITGLSPNTTYYYTFYGTNSAATNQGWSIAATFRTPGSDEWTGTADDLWGNAANWGGTDVPDSGGESALFIDKGTGDVDLGGTSYAIASVTFDGGDYTLVDTNAAPGSLTVSSITNRAGANGINVGMTVNGTADVSGGSLALGKTDAFGASQFRLNSGTLIVNGAESSTAGIGMKGFHIAPDGPMDLNNNGGLMELSPWGDVILNANLSFNGDQSFMDAGAIEQDHWDNYMVLFLGYFNAPTNGNYDFITDWGDDRRGLWLDLDQDGVFESSTPGLGSGRGEQLAWQDGGVKTVTLVGGEKYLFAVTFGEYGGGASIQLRFKTPLMGGHVVANPSDISQAGLWTVGSAGPVDLASIPVNVVDSSTVRATSGTNVTALGDLTISDGATLTTASGSAQSFESTTLPGGATAVAFSPAVDTTLTRATGLDGSAASVTLSHTGSGSLILDLPGSNLDSAIFDVQSGSLVAVHSNAFGGAALSLNGGELLLSSPTGDVTYVKDVTVVTNSALTAGQAGSGVVGPLTNTLSGSISFSGTETLTVRATDEYVLRLAGQIAGSGTVSVTEGTVVIDDTEFENLQITGGTAELNGTLTARTLIQTGGAIAGLTGNLIVQDTLSVLNPGNTIDFSGKTLDLTTADLTIDHDTTLQYDQALLVNSATFIDNNARLIIDGAGLTATETVTVPWNSTLTLGGPLTVNTLNMRGLMTVVGPITGGFELHFWPRDNNMRVVDNLLTGTASVYLSDPNDNWGYVALTATNAYTGVTQTRYANLRADEGVGLPLNSRVIFNAGGQDWPNVWETSGTITRNIGTDAGDVYWQDQGGGFAAVGGDLTISLEGNALLTWSNATNGFNNVPALKLGSKWSTGKTELTNPIFIDRNDCNFEIGNNQVDNNLSLDTVRDVVRLSGTLSGDRSWNSEQLRFTAAHNRTFGYGRGLVELTGTNTYSQRTVLNGGSVYAVDGVGLPSNSILIFQRSDFWTENVLLSHGTFARGIGSDTEAPGTVSWWWGPGGFAALGGDLTVTFTNTPTPLLWGSNNRGFNNQDLVLGSQYASNVVEITNPIDLEGGDRYIIAWDNPWTDQDIAILSGAISGTTHGQRLTKTMPGTVWLRGTNTFQQYLAIDWGAVRVDNVNDQIASGSTISFWNWQRGDDWPKTLEAKGAITNDLDGNWQTPNAISYQQGGGGFSAYGGPLSVNLEGGSQLLWGDANAGFSGRGFHLGSRTANDVVTLENDIDIQGGWRTIRAWDNPHSDSDWGVVAGRLTSTGNGHLNMFGDGMVKFTGTNALHEVRIEDHVTALINGEFTVSNFMDSNNGQGPDWSHIRRLPGSGANPTLGGNGTIIAQNEVRLRGWSPTSFTTLAPGDNNAGILSATTSGGSGFVLENSNVTYEWELGPGISDKVALTGNLWMGNGWRVKLLSAGGTPRPNEEYDLFTYSGTCTYTAPAIDASETPADWVTNGMSIVHDTESKRIYLTGIYSVLSVANDPATDITATSATLNGVISAESDPLYATVYWSTNNGGTDASAWLASGFSADLGAYTNVVGEALAHGIAGLSSNELWAYTFRATNATGSIDLWGAPTIAFNAAGAPIVTNTGAGSFGPGTATLGGLFLDHNRAEITLCWGTTDGGTGLPAAWQYSTNIGTQAGADFAGTAHSVLYGAGQYVYRIYASNPYGTGWSDPATVFSQNAQPGILPAFASLTAHFDAALGTTVDGNGVVTWEDQSGEGHTATRIQGTMHIAPNAINGLPAVEFAGNAYAAMASNMYSKTQFIVTRMNGGDWGSWMGSDIQAGYMWNQNGNCWDQNIPAAVSKNGAPLPGYPFYLGDNRNTEYMILKIVGNNNNTSQRPYFLGKQQVWISLNNFMAEMISFNTTLSPDDENKVGAYLAAKYGIATSYPEAGSVSALTSTPATNVTFNTAWLNASLSCAGAVFELTAFWGPDNQSTNATLWANSAPMGTFADGEFSPTLWVSGLPELSTNYFTFRATNLLQTLWANNVASLVTDTSTLGARFTGTPLTGGNPLTVNFIDTSTGTNITSRLWDFGDGNTSNTLDTVVWHTYTNVGSYAVQLIVSDSAEGTSSTNTKPAYIFVSSPLISIDFNGSGAPTNAYGPGVMGFASDTWNYISFTDDWSSDKPVTNLVDSSGADSGVTFTYTEDGTVSFNTWGQGTDPLFGDYLGAWGGGEQGLDIVLSGMKPGTYDVCVFGTESLSFTANGSVPATLDGSAPSTTTTFQQGASYAILHATVQNDGLLTLLTTGNGRFAGFQIRDSRGATWTGDDIADDDWGSADNWSVSGAPDGIGAGAIFGSALAAGHAVATLDGNRTVSWLDFLNSVPTTLDAGSGALTLADWTLANGDVLSPTVKLYNNANHAINANLAGTAGLRFIADGAAGGGSVMRLTLAGANTYSGTTLIDGPGAQQWTYLVVGSAQALGTSGIEFGPHLGQERQVLQLNGFDISVPGLNVATGNDGGGFGSFGAFVVNNSSTNCTLTIDTATAHSTYNGNFSDVGSGTLAIVKDGSFSLTLREFNTFHAYSGGLTIKDGKLVPNGIGSVLGTGPLTMGDNAKTGTLVFDGSGTLSKDITLAAGGAGAFEFSANMTLSGVISGGGGLTKTAAGTLTLTNPTNSWDGATRVEAGTLSIGSSHLADLADVYLTTGATLDLNFAGNDTIQELFFDDVAQAVGTWGAPGSGAVNTNAFFTGPGILNVSGAIPVPPTALFSATPTNGVSPLAVTFTDTSTGTITNRFWDFGDGTTTNTTVTIVLHTYTNTGTFSVQLLVTGSLGSSTNTQSDLIVVSAGTPPTPTFDGSVFTLSLGTSSIQFDTVAGYKYGVDYKDALTNAVWLPLIYNPDYPLPDGWSSISTGGMLMVTDTNAVDQPNRYYRLKASTP